MNPIRHLIPVLTLAGSALCGGCVLVPVNPDGSVHVPPKPVPVAIAPALPVPPAAPATMLLPVRLYPTNDLAAQTGIVGGTVTRHATGRADFNLDVAGERISGQATRLGEGGSDGVANGTGGRGSFVECQYHMNSATQGVGSCRFSSGATYQIHIGG